MDISRAYELMIIVDSDVDDGDIDAVISRVEGLIVEEGGRIASTDNWGRRRFAYEIQHKLEGTYVVWGDRYRIGGSSQHRTPVASRGRHCPPQAFPSSGIRSGPPWSVRGGGAGLSRFTRRYLHGI